MTIFDLHPVVPLLAVLGIVILWGVRRRVAARVAARRLATVAIGLLMIVVVISLSIRFVAPGPQIASSRLLNWRLNGGAVFGLNRSGAAQTSNVITIEVEHPYCAPVDIGPWLADPIISSTPWSVTITMHMGNTPDVAKCRSQQTPHEGPLPLVGGYLMGIIYNVQLGEPLGGRALFDGSSFPPEQRSLPGSA